MNAVKIDDDILKYPTKLLDFIISYTNIKDFIFFINTEHIESLNKLQILHEINFKGHLKWVYIGFNNKFELMVMDGQPNNEMLICNQSEIEHMFRIRKIKKLLNKKKE